MSDYSLDDAYSEALELEDKVDEARDKAVGFYLIMDKDNTDDGLLSGLSETVEAKVESAHNAYTDLMDNLSDVEQIREQLSTPENIIDEAEDRYLEDEMEDGDMSEVIEYFDISIDPVERPPENPEETVRFIVENLRDYEDLHNKIERSSYDFDLPPLEFEKDAGEIIEETAEETIDRERPDEGQFFTEE